MAGAVTRLRNLGVDEEELCRKIAAATVSAYAEIEAAPKDTLTADVDLVSGGVRLLDSDGHPVEISGPTTRKLAELVPKVILEWLSELDRARIATIAAPLYLQLVDGVLARKEGSTWLLACPQFPAVLPAAEQMPGEELSEEQHLSVVVLGGRPAPARPGVVVSRSHPALILRLLEAEVPEVASGQVVVKAVARDPGRRSKIAVSTSDPAIDPQGACIGPHGIRHRALMERLGREQLQFVLFDDNAEQFISNSLAPARPIHMELLHESRTARVTVTEDELPSAIGRAGENARLAARLTGWKIDIHTPSSPSSPPSSAGAEGPS